MPQSLRCICRRVIRRHWCRRGYSKFECLPTEIILHILSYCRPKDIRSLLLVATRLACHRKDAHKLSLVSTRFRRVLVLVLYRDVFWCPGIKKEPCPTKISPLVRNLTLDLVLECINVQRVQRVLSLFSSLTSIHILNTTLETLQRIMPLIEKMPYLAVLHLQMMRHVHAGESLPTNIHVRTLRLCYSLDDNYLAPDVPSLGRSLIFSYLHILRELEIDSRLVDLETITALSTSKLHSLTISGSRPPTIDPSLLLRAISMMSTLRSLEIWCRELKRDNGTPFILATQKAKVPLNLTRLKLSNFKPGEHFISYMPAEAISVTLLHNPRQSVCSAQTYAVPSSEQMLTILQNSQLGSSLKELCFAIEGEIDCDLLKFIAVTYPNVETMQIQRCWTSGINLLENERDLAVALSGLRHLRHLQFDIGYVDQDPCRIHLLDNRMNSILRVHRLAVLFGEHIQSLEIFGMPLVISSFAQLWVPAFLIRRDDGVAAAFDIDGIMWKNH